MNKQNKQRLTDLYLSDSRLKYPSVPEYARPIPNFTEKGANALTKCVIDFLTWSGWQAERISSSGRYIDDSKQVTNVVGITKTIGSGKWIPGNTRNGTADISATVQGRSIKIEIKYGKDQQSDVQKRYQSEVESAGGVYIIVRNVDGFIEWYDNFIKSIT